MASDGVPEAIAHAPHSLRHATDVVGYLRSRGADGTTPMSGAAARAGHGRVDPWREQKLHTLPTERAIEHAFDPLTNTWTQIPVFVKIESTSFARGAQRECFRMRRLWSDQAGFETLCAKSLVDGLDGLSADASARFREETGVQDSIGDLWAKLQDPAVGPAVRARLLASAAPATPVASTDEDAVVEEADGEGEDQGEGEGEGEEEEAAETTPLESSQIAESLAALEVAHAASQRLWEEGPNFVAKSFLKPDVAREQTFEDVKVQMISKAWGDEYNRSNPPKRVEFIALHALELTERPRQPIFAVEPLIEGSYVKYNNNAGHIVDEVHRQTPNAFSHFTFERSRGRLMVVDVQGVGDMYTDPQIHTCDGEGYGEGNLGIRGFALFFSTHAYTPLCRLLGLRPFQLSPPEEIKLRALIESAAARWQSKLADRAAASAAALHLVASTPITFLGTHSSASGGGGGAAAAGLRSLLPPDPHAFIRYVPLRSGRTSLSSSTPGVSPGASPVPAASSSSSSSSSSAAAPAMRVEMDPETAAHLTGVDGLAVVDELVVVPEEEESASPEAHLLEGHSSALAAQGDVERQKELLSAIGRGSDVLRTPRETGGGGVEGGAEGGPETPAGRRERSTSEAEGGDETPGGLRTPLPIASIVPAPHRSGGAGGSGVRSGRSRTSGMGMTPSIALASLASSSSSSASSSSFSSSSFSSSLAPRAEHFAAHSPVPPARSGGLLASTPAYGSATTPGFQPGERGVRRVAGAADPILDPTSVSGRLMHEAEDAASRARFELIVGMVHYELACCHAVGRLEHMDKDVVNHEAVLFHLRRAASRYALAQIALGRLFDGVPMDPFPNTLVAPSRLRAFRCFLKAAKQGNRDAMLWVAAALESGIPEEAATPNSLRSASGSVAHAHSAAAPAGSATADAASSAGVDARPTLAIAEGGDGGSGGGGALVGSGLAVSPSSEASSLPAVSPSPGPSTSLPSPALWGVAAPSGVLFSPSITPAMVSHDALPPPELSLDGPGESQDAAAESSASSASSSSASADSSVVGHAPAVPSPTASSVGSASRLDHVEPDFKLAALWYEAAGMTDADLDPERSSLEKLSYECLVKAADLYEKGGPNLEADTMRAYNLLMAAAERAGELGRGRAAMKISERAESME